MPIPEIVPLMKACLSGHMGVKGGINEETYTRSWCHNNKEW